MSPAMATGRPTRDQGSQALRHRDEARAIINDEIGRLQAAEALLIALKFTADHDHPYDAGRALSAILKIIEQTLAALDQLEVAL